MSEHAFEFEIPEEVIASVSIATGITIDPLLKLNITYSEEKQRYHISEVNDLIVTKNPELRLLDGTVFKNSLDMYSNEEI